MPELIEQYDLKFEKLYALYEEYNSHTNISAIRDREGVYHKHFDDSLVAIPFILKQYPRAKSGMKVIDVGTGGGFPALPLSIVLGEDFPDIEITALDSISKKTRFVDMVREKLQLANLRVITSRAEDLKAHHGLYDVALSRALAYLPDALKYIKPLLKPGGIYIAYKKQDIEHEIADAAKVCKKLNIQLEQTYIYAGKQLLIYRA